MLPSAKVENHCSHIFFEQTSYAFWMTAKSWFGDLDVCGRICLLNFHLPSTQHLHNASYFPLKGFLLPLFTAFVVVVPIPPLLRWISWIASLPLQGQSNGSRVSEAISWIHRYQRWLQVWLVAAMAKMVACSCPGFSTMRSSLSPALGCLALKAPLIISSHSQAWYHCLLLCHPPLPHPVLCQ